ncbi:DNA/RNA non-specific endonuclease [Mucilaginibacter lutimaris]|uniref:DNA/RNA non-specific endonuclease n=1 Tax=Mucilaginibacter lutimaris TaxID=931629 RepID=A0ABW2ZE72_9SPHI
MKRVVILLFWLFPILLKAQAPDAAYVKALYQQYPTQRTDLCPSCKLWVNPYFRSVADTLHHIPVLTFYIYTKAHRLEQEALNLPRTGIYASWHAVAGQPDETKVYREANRQIGKPNSAEMIAKGHCQPWILLSWSGDAAILSNTYTFNAGMEFQGQNVGTELATEELCRKLTGYRTSGVTDSVSIWCGTSGIQSTYSKDNITISVPANYYKIIKYYDHKAGGEVVQCFWMPNEATEKKSKLAERMVSHQELIGKLGFDPLTIFVN